VLLSSASHFTTQERRRVAWSRINPSTVSLLQEDMEESKKESTLFGGGFLERAAKKAGRGESPGEDDRGQAQRKSTTKAPTGP